MRELNTANIVLHLLTIFGSWRWPGWIGLHCIMMKKTLLIDLNKQNKNYCFIYKQMKLVNDKKPWLQNVAHLYYIFIS